MKIRLVAGLAYGDEGKGATTDALVRKYDADLVVRYNGGAQCAHTVVNSSGQSHSFAQFGSGTFVPGCRTYLSQYVLVNPGTMLMEEQALRKLGITDAWSRMYVHKKAVVTTPYQIAINRIQEMHRGASKHGSTGMGIGITREDHINYGEKVLLVEDLANPPRIHDKLIFIRELCLKRLRDLSPHIESEAGENELFRLVEENETTPWILGRYAEWYEKMRFNIRDFVPIEDKDVIFEGAQGMLLDEVYGFNPHTTWTDITFRNAFKVLDLQGLVGHHYPIEKIGVVRSYYTRHGAGPFASEDPDVQFDEPHNEGNAYTGKMRKGNFDLPLFLYSLRCIGGVDYLAVNHMDVFHPQGRMKVRISKDETIEIPRKNFLPMLTEMTGTPVRIVGHGPSSEDREFR